MKTAASRGYTFVFLYVELRNEWNVSEHGKNATKREILMETLIPVGFHFP